MNASSCVEVLSFLKNSFFTVYGSLTHYKNGNSVEENEGEEMKFTARDAYLTHDLIYVA